MKKFLLILALLLSARAGAQDINELLQRIEANNLTLKALREQAEADKSGNRKGITLPDPEIEAGRLWGRPSEIGNRVDFSISQSIDLATLSGARLRAAKRRNELIDLGLLTQRTAILLQAKQLIIECIYYDKLSLRQQQGMTDLRELVQAYESKLQAGEVSQMEVNRIKLSAANLVNDANRTLEQTHIAHTQLRRLNGNQNVAGFASPAWFPDVSPISRYDEWYPTIIDRIPALRQARREAELSEKEVGLARAEGLPKLKVGYMQERTLGQRYGGVTVGLSIPLWSNRNNVRAARAAASAAEMRQADVAAQTEAQLMGSHTRVRQMENLMQQTREALLQNDNTALMRKALDAGEISMTDYLLDRQQYYELQDKALEAERDYHLALSELMAFEL